MWLQIDDIDSSASVFGSYGRALFVAQHFEGLCRDILMWFRAALFFSEPDNNPNWSEYTSYAEKLAGQFLGKAIDEFETVKTRFGISADDIADLMSAKSSRNWIVHEMCSDAIAPSSATRGRQLEVPVELGDHLSNVAAGGYLVSRWSFEFHEQQSGWFIDRDRYVNRVVDWVLE